MTPPTGAISRTKGVRGSPLNCVIDANGSLPALKPKSRSWRMPLAAISVFCSSHVLEGAASLQRPESTGSWCVRHWPGRETIRSSEPGNLRPSTAPYQCMRQRSIVRRKSVYRLADVRFGVAEPQMSWEQSRRSLMLGVAIIASRAANRRALLVGIAGMAATVMLLDRIAVAATNSTTVQSHSRQHLKSRTSLLTRVGSGAQRRPQIGARERQSLPPYFPFE